MNKHKAERYPVLLFAYRNIRSLIKQNQPISLDSLLFFRRTAEYEHLTLFWGTRQRKHLSFFSKLLHHHKKYSCKSPLLHTPQFFFFLILPLMDRNGQENIRWLLFFSVTYSKKTIFPKYGIKIMVTMHGFKFPTASQSYIVYAYSCMYVCI